MSALALWHGECRSRVREVMHQVVSEPCIGHVSCTVENRGGFHYQAEFLYLPLRSDMGEMTRILGCGYYMGEDRRLSVAASQIVNPHCRALKLLIRFRVQRWTSASPICGPLMEVWLIVRCCAAMRKFANAIICVWSNRTWFEPKDESVRVVTKSKSLTIVAI